MDRSSSDFRISRSFLGFEAMVVLDLEAEAARETLAAACLAFFAVRSFRSARAVLAGSKSASIETPLAQIQKPLSLYYSKE